MRGEPWDSLNREEAEATRTEIDILSDRVLELEDERDRLLTKQANHDAQLRFWKQGYERVRDECDRLTKENVSLDNENIRLDQEVGRLLEQLEANNIKPWD
jgi:hypothetical protein